MSYSHTFIHRELKHTEFNKLYDMCLYVYMLFIDFTE